MAAGDLAAGNSFGAVGPGSKGRGAGSPNPTLHSDEPREVALLAGLLQPFQGSVVLSGLGAYSRAVRTAGTEVQFERAASFSAARRSAAK